MALLLFHPHPLLAPRMRSSRPVSTINPSSDKIPEGDVDGYVTFSSVLPHACDQVGQYQPSTPVPMWCLEVLVMVMIPSTLAPMWCLVALVMGRLGSAPI